MSKAAALALLLRRERSELAAVGLVTMLIAFTAFVGSGAVRMFERAADEGLRREVGAAPVVQRTVLLTTSRSVLGQASDQTVAGWQAEGEELRAAFAGPVRDLAGEANLAVGSVRLRVLNPPVYPIYITLRYQDEFPELAELVSGRWPASTNERLPPVATLQTAPGGQRYPVGTNHASDEPRPFEIALQEATARQLGVEIGSSLSVGVDLVDPMIYGSVLGRADIILAPTDLVVTGLYRVRDPDSDAWFGEPELRLDDPGLSGLEPIAYIHGYVPPDAMPGLVTSGLPFEYRWRYSILADRLDAGAADEIVRGLRILESTSAGTDARQDVTADTGLLSLLERHGELRAASEGVLGMASSAPLALAGGALAMAAVLLTRSRRAAMILARGRGASGRLVLAASLVEALVVAVVGCLAGLGLAMALEPAAEFRPSLFIAVSIGVVAILVLGGAAWPQIRQPLGDLERGVRPARRADPRRLVMELTVIAIAVVGASVLRQRGLSAESVGFDPFLAAVPPLIAVAAGMVAVRLYRPAMAVAGWVADRRRDLVPVLGLRTIARGAASTLPVLVLILAVAFAAFSSVITTSVDWAQRAASWNVAGADVRLEPQGSRRELPSGFDATAIPGVTATARGFTDQQARTPSETITVRAVDAAAYASVVAGSPIEPNWPSAFLDQPSDGPVPAIVGSGLAVGALRLSPGDTLRITAQGRGVQLQVVQVRSGLAGLAPGDSFVVVPYSWLEQAVGREIPASVMWVRVPQEAVAAVNEQISAEADAIELASRYAAYDELRDAPLTRAVSTGFALAFGVSVAFAVLTILDAVLLSVGRRIRDDAVLRTLGLDGRQQTRLTMVEHAPPILLALLPGLALGIGVAYAVAPGLGLSALAGSSGDVPLIIDWVALATLSAALAALALSAVMVGSWLSRRTAIMNALRIASD